MAEKSGRMSALEQGGGVTDEEKLPPTSSKAGFVRPMRSACPTTSDTPPATPFSEDFFNPLAALLLNLRTGIYNTALAPLVDIPPLSAVEQCSRKRKARMGRKKTGGLVNIFVTIADLYLSSLN